LQDQAQEVKAMAGDVNLYVNDPEDPTTVEIEVMVAELGCRRKGIACEAVTLMMAFAVQRLGITRFRCGCQHTHGHVTPTQGATVPQMLPADPGLAYNVLGSRGACVCSISMPWVV
jgi:hypothetical protein